MGKRRCPNCGKRAPEGVVCCRNCGHSIPIGPTELGLLVAGPDEDGPSNSGPTDEYIDDPELLERAEEDVRRVPLRLPFSEPIEASTADKADEPRPVGWECPACGRQAQRGWKACPWCRRPLPAYIWKPEEQERTHD